MLTTAPRARAEGFSCSGGFVVTPLKPRLGELVVLFKVGVMDGIAQVTEALEQLLKFLDHLWSSSFLFSQQSDEALCRLVGRRLQGAVGVTRSAPTASTTAVSAS